MSVHPGKSKGETCDPADFTFFNIKTLDWKETIPVFQEE